MEKIPRRADLSADEWTSLVEIVAYSFMSKGSLPASRRARLVALGLIQDAMGGVVPTPAGRVVARM
jgi:hypothetical protein